MRPDDKVVPWRAISLSWATVVVSRLMLWRTRLRSVRNSKDLMILRVRVADVFGRASFVWTSEKSEDIRLQLSQSQI